MLSSRSMTDIKDRLELIKRERKTRSKSKYVLDAWERLEQDKSSSTRDKLEQLIRLKRPEPKMPEVPKFEPVEREPLRFTENRYSLDAKYGKITISSGLKISGDVLAFLSRDPDFGALDLSTALFIDLETTGLSGGTGVIPFNIGLGYYRENNFWVGQYFLGELAEEERMLQELNKFISDMDFQSVVTYNGKVFDLPLLETRCILHRLPFCLSNLPHLDFLFAARSLWQHKYDNCRLSYLAKEVLVTGRDDDIPSSEIPWRYFQYIQTGNYDLIEPILYHNAEDILSLLGVVILGANIFSEDPEGHPVDAMDLYGAGKVMEKVGKSEKALEFFNRALNGNLSEKVKLSTRRKLASRYKSSQEWEKALALWQEMAYSELPSSDLLYALRELSMFYEHREQKYLEAQKYAEEGFVLARGFSSHYEKDFTHRRERIKDKIRKTDSES